MTELPDLHRLSHNEKDALIRTLWARVLRFTHAANCRRLVRLLNELFGLCIGEGALDAVLRRALPSLDAAVGAVLFRLRWARLVGSDETGVHIDRRPGWNRVFQNHEVMDGRRPAIWVSDIYSAQQSRAADWQICLVHQLRDCRFAVGACDPILAPRMKAWLLCAVVLARRRHRLAESTRRQYRQRLERDLDAIMALALTARDGRRLRKRHSKHRCHLPACLKHPEVGVDNNANEHALRPTATNRKVTGGFRSFVGNADRRGMIPTKPAR